MDCYIMHSFVSDHITIHNCYYFFIIMQNINLNKKCIAALKIQKVDDNNGLKKLVLKIAHVNISMS